MITFRRTANAFALLALMLSGASLSAQDAQRMETIVSASEDDGKFMGTALVAIGDEILLDSGYGSANLEWDISNSPRTKFRIGSVTKQFTAAAILLLAERGEINLDEAIGTYWSKAPASWDAVTIRHLLHHTSGIPNVTSFEDFGKWKYLPTERDELIARFSDKPLEFEPGAKWAYSNSGYLLLSAIVEEVGGSPYAEFVKENFFTPLQMADTAIDVTAEIVPYRASGYSPSDDAMVNADYVDMGIPQGAGALYSTTHDLLKWQRGLFGGKVLRPESLAMMVAPAIEAMPDSGYGMGVLVTEKDDGRLIWHGGGIEGFNSFLGHDPDRNITVVVLANLNGGAANTLGQSLVTLARGGEVTLPSERVTADLPIENLAQYEGVYAITPEFKISIFERNGALMTQATGQDAFPIFAEERKDWFFLKVVDARLHFQRDDNGDVTGLVLHQGGREAPATKE
ncbi:serine hydrolase [Erythrobacter aquimaris]|uniref:Serine hydrolase n=1 Tax=Qipengyuania aquimaris TaxID=255984 RepID=A0A6I4TJ75_9SPHN|nr:serine hydrolase [Qipengyuania aquimaris]MXO95924.1 serine hydrolase [Qipengyuania aquimaris]